ncbi:MAG: ferredoxin [Candidatus Aureabacteria bacterium]|nr:ferredoxin [Candidatus Auribacterota bacterium]
MRAIVDEETCIGCGLCPQICPEVFRTEGDKAVVYADPVPDGFEESCKDAANQCPVNAISVEEA